MSKRIQCKKCGVFIQHGHMKDHRAGTNGYSKCDPKEAEERRKRLVESNAALNRFFFGGRPRRGATQS